MQISVLMKKGKISPSPPKNKKNLVITYRPVSLLQICSKVFEILIYIICISHLQI